MERAVELVRLRGLMSRTRGRAEVRVGLVDGMVQAADPLLANARVHTLRTGDGPCGAGCKHGTYLATLLVGDGGLCPGVTLVSRPVFLDRPGGPSSRPDHIADAIHELLDAGTQVINISGGVAAGGLKRYPAVEDACGRAASLGALVVAASGNQSRVGTVPLFGHEWVIPVAACDPDGAPDPRSNIGPTVGRRGLRAPGYEMRVGNLAMQGSSVATAFVTGTFALLRSLFPQRPSVELRNAVLLEPRRRASVIPPLLDAARTLEALR
jgi:subtilisin family serine protease